MHNLHHDGWGLKMQSFICGKNVWFDFCKGGELNCFGRFRLHSGAGHVKNQRLNYLENEISMLIQGPYDPRQIGAVTLFEDDNCAGGMARFYYNPESKANGTHYEFKDFLYAGMRRDSMNSLMVPKGYSVMLSEHTSFQGRKQYVDGAFKDTSENMVCVSATLPDTL